MSNDLSVDPVKDRDKDQVVWTIARRLPTFSYFQLAAEAHISVKAATALVGRWRAAGAVDHVGVGPLGRMMFAVTRDGDRTPSREHRRLIDMTPEQAMWIAIRRCGSFTAVDIGALVNSDDRAITPEAVRAYIQILLAAGYLRVVRRSVHRKAPAAYRLIRDSGPVAPVTRRLTVTYDANLDEVVHVPAVSK